MIHLFYSDINLYAVFVAWIIHVGMGLLWFQPKLFGNKWSELTGQQLKPASKWIVPGFLGHLIMILVLAVLIDHTRSNSGCGGLLIGLLAWIGFIVPMEIGELVWEKIPFKLFLIRTGNHLIGMAVSGFILGAWR
jgi:hypothetical protein